MNRKEKLTENGFWCRLVLSLCAMLGCTAVFAASTWALFYTKVSTPNSTISGAYYSVTVDTVDNGEYICPLTYDDQHTFRLNAQGTATTGCCRIQVGDNLYITDPIPQGSSLQIQIQAAEGTRILFTSMWGASAADAGLRISDNTIQHSKTPYAEYIIEENGVLEEIAAYYGVTAERIVRYNGSEELVAGNVLKIPGVSPDTPSYQVPVPETQEMEESKPETSEMQEEPVQENPEADEPLPEKSEADEQLPEEESVNEADTEDNTESPETEGPIHTQCE